MKQDDESVTISSFMILRSIKKILALALPFYLLLQFVGCLSVCAWEVAEHDNVEFASHVASCSDAHTVECSVETLPKLTASERAPRGHQSATVPAIAIVRPILPAAKPDMSPRPKHHPQFSPTFQRPLVLRI